MTKVSDRVERTTVCTMALGRLMSWGRKFSARVVKAATRNRNSRGLYSCSSGTGSREMFQVDGRHPTALLLLLH